MKNLYVPTYIHVKKKPESLLSGHVLASIMAVDDYKDRKDDYGRLSPYSEYESVYKQLNEVGAVMAEALLVMSVCVKMGAQWWE